MPPSKPKPKTSPDLNALFKLMEPWPDSWAGDDEDIPVGQGLVDEMKPFIAHLCSLGLSPKTVRRHLDACWVIGGEIIRNVEEEPKRSRKSPLKLILDAVDMDEAPLVHDASEQEQRSFDATAKKLHRFLVEKHFF
jgi:hypothetical protein